MAEPLRIDVEHGPEVEGRWVWLRIPKAVVVISYDEFVAGLRRGKAFIRRQAYEQRVEKEGGCTHG